MTRTLGTYHPGIEFWNDGGWLVVLGSFEQSRLKEGGEVR